MLMRILILAILSILTLPNHFTAADIFQEQRQTMVTRDIKGRGIGDRQLLAAMEKVPRHLLVGDRYRYEAYADHPLLISEGTEGGRLILPLGSTVFYQTLTLVTKRKGGELDVQQLDPVAFVPMTGEAQKR